jgi:choline dehydrogenase-like flavoprotein
MGDNTKASVVDKWHHPHDVCNHFVVDASSLVTCGRQQPTETMQALPYRAADYMAHAARRNEI